MGRGFFLFAEYVRLYKTDDVDAVTNGIDACQGRFDVLEPMARQIGNRKAAAIGRQASW